MVKRQWATHQRGFVHFQDLTLDFHQVLVIFSAFHSKTTPKPGPIFESGQGMGSGRYTGTARCSWYTFA